MDASEVKEVAGALAALAAFLAALLGIPKYLQYRTRRDKMALVRDAFESVDSGPLLDRVFRQALAVGKRVRTETAIGESPASVSSAAAALAAQVFGGSSILRPRSALPALRTRKK